MKKINIPKEILEYLYVEKNLGSREVAKILGCSKPTVLKNLREYGIRIRRNGEPTEARMKAIEKLKEWIKNHPEEHREHAKKGAVSRIRSMRQHPEFWKEIYKQIGAKSSRRLRGRTVSMNVRAKISKIIKKLYEEGKVMGFRNKDVLRKVARAGKLGSKPQHELYEVVKREYPDAKYNYPVETKHSIRFLDIAIPSLKIDVEYDGEKWHQDREADELRDLELREIGWETIRVNKENSHEILDMIKEVVMSHADSRGVWLKQVRLGIVTLQGNGE